ncbi:uncharacterized protein N7459_003003 [Penicillium hispanicum]|uniref:uncharacterized protein n=1 Tax=Penicillium hispanicum TaxID=1080232 RepID=UPI002540A17A|nr:uncharacterized protein N7459_003003 [Penicillium hispanicum]KAJ5587238.1 hypothetical protein N7459_003003 [Penicillium hispanicum]
MTKIFVMSKQEALMLDRVIRDTLSFSLRSGTFWLATAVWPRDSQHNNPSGSPPRITITTLNPSLGHLPHSDTCRTAGDLSPTMGLSVTGV